MQKLFSPWQNRGVATDTTLHKAARYARHSGHVTYGPRNTNYFVDFSPYRSFAIWLRRLIVALFSC